MTASLGFFHRKLVKIGLTFVCGWWGYWQWHQHERNNEWLKDNTEWLTAKETQVDELSRCLVGYLGQRGDWATIVGLAAATRTQGDPNSVVLSLEGTVQQRVTLPYEAWPQLGWALRSTQDRMELNKTEQQLFNFDSVYLEGEEPNRLWYVRFELPLKIGLRAHVGPGGVPWRWHMLRGEGCLRIVGNDIPLPPSIEYQILKEIEEEERSRNEILQEASSADSAVTTSPDDDKTAEADTKVTENTAKRSSVHNAVFRFDWHRITLDDEEILGQSPPADRTFLRIHEKEVSLGTLVVPEGEKLPSKSLKTQPKTANLRQPLDFYFFFRKDEE